MQLHNYSDLAIWLAYLAIPLVILYFLRRRPGAQFHALYWLFAAFIVACGTTHLMEYVTFQTPMYRASGAIKFLTAGVSWATVLALVPTMPRALALPELPALNQSLRVEIEAREKAEVELRRRADELARSNAELQQFAYVASHDLREPLRMISSYTSLLQRRYAGKLDKDADEFIGFAVEGAERMQALIDGVLSIATVGTHALELSDASCEKACDQALAQLDVAVREERAQITRGPLPTVRADARLLVLVFQNLIGNALKFHGDAPPRIHVDAVREGSRWRIRVRDQGIGIAPEHRERIFTLFQRLHPRTRYPGTGIGLALCKKIVELHGGALSVESEVGQGATFSFTLDAQGPPS